MTEKEKKETAEKPTTDSATPKQETKEAKQETLSLSKKDILQWWKHSGKKYSKYAFVLLLLIPIILSISFRIQPMYLPQAESWAQGQVDSQVRNQLAPQLYQQYPGVNQQQLKQILDTELIKFRTQNKQGYDAQVAQLAQQYKSGFQNENGQTYLLAIDPYQYYRYTRNIVDHGHLGDEKKDGVLIDKKMLAPLGRPRLTSFFPYLTAYVYNIVSFFNRDLSVLTMLFLMPLLIMTLATIPAFFIGRKIGGNLAGLLAASIIAIHPVIMTRTVAGFADTDAFGVFFPLMIIWLFIEALDAVKFRNKMILSVIAGIFTGIFVFAWAGWWVTFDLVMGAAIFYLLFLIGQYKWNHMKQWKEEGWFKHLGKRFKGMFWGDKTIKETWMILLSYIIISGIGISLIRGTRYFIDIIERPIFFITRISSAVRIKGALWPNVYTTVAELNKVSYEHIFRSMGTLFFFIAIVASLWLFWKYREKINVFYGILIGMWLLGMIYATRTGGVRFIMYIIPPLALGWAVTVSKAYDLVRWIINLLLEKISIKIFKKETKAQKHIRTGINIAVVILLLIGIFSMLGFSPISPICKKGMCASAQSTAYNTGPSFDDGWNNILSNIKAKSQPDAIINSWWDFGHWFKAYGDRAVTFDGASQNRPQAHWVGKALVTSDEKESAAILRMLDCGAHTAHDAIENKTQNPLAASRKTYELLKLNKAAALQNLKADGYTEEETQNIMNRMFCDPPENYFITSADMIGKAGVWSHFGLWNFERAQIWRDVKSLSETDAVAYLKKELNYTPTKAKEMYESLQRINGEAAGNAWISPWPNYISQGNCITQDGKLLCETRLQNQQLLFEIDPQTKDIKLANAEGTNVPHSITWTEGNTFHSKQFDGPVLPYSVSLLESGNNYYIRFMQAPLAESMFNRLFFHNGIGLTKFNRFDRQRSITTGDISVWKVNWEGK